MCCFNVVNIHHLAANCRGLLRDSTYQKLEYCYYSFSDLNIVPVVSLMCELSIWVFVVHTRFKWRLIIANLTTSSSFIILLLFLQKRVGILLCSKHCGLKFIKRKMSSYYFYIFTNPLPHSLFYNWYYRFSFHMKGRTHNRFVCDCTIYMVICTTNMS